MLDQAPWLRWPRTRTYEALTRAQLALGQGDYDAVEQLLVDASGDPAGNVAHEVARVTTEVEFRLARAGFRDAVELAERWIDVAEASAPASAVRLCALGARAAVDAAQGVDAAAWSARAGRLVAGGAAGVADAVAWCAVARAWASTAAGTSRLEHWATAAGAFDEVECVVRAAEARAEMARALLDAGDRLGARQVARSGTRGRGACRCAPTARAPRSAARAGRRERDVERAG